MHVRLYDRVTGDTFLTTELNAEEVLARSGERYGRGDVCPDAERITEAAWLRATGQTPQTVAERPNRVLEGGSLPLPEADAPAPLEQSSRPVETATPAAAAVAPKPDPLDHDGDGHKGGAKRSPEEETLRAEVIAQLRAKDVTFFAGSSTAKLQEILAGA